MFRGLFGALTLGVTGCWFLGRKARQCGPVNAVVDVARRDTARAIAEIHGDIKAVQERDPAATSQVEILTSYPGLHALWIHRLAHRLQGAGVPIVPRWLSQLNRFLTGHRDPPGRHHRAGPVHRPRRRRRDRRDGDDRRQCHVYQGVTLGGTGKQSGKRHPTVGDNVVFGAGAKVLGAIRVGDNAKVGAGSVVVADVPDDSTVVGNPGRPVLLEGQRVGIPDIDYRHLPDPVAEAVKCLVTRIVDMEHELDEINPERKEQGQAAMAETRERIAALLHFDDGAGI